MSIQFLPQFENEEVPEKFKYVIFKRGLVEVSKTYELYKQPIVVENIFTNLSYCNFRNYTIALIEPILAQKTNCTFYPKITYDIYSFTVRDTFVDVRNLFNSIKNTELMKECLLYQLSSGNPEKVGHGLFYYICNNEPNAIPSVNDFIKTANYNEKYVVDRLNNITSEEFDIMLMKSDSVLDRDVLYTLLSNFKYSFALEYMDKCRSSSKHKLDIEYLKNDQKLINLFIKFSHIMEVKKIMEWLKIEVNNVKLEIHDIRHGHKVYKDTICFMDMDSLKRYIIANYPSIPLDKVIDEEALSVFTTTNEQIVVIK